MTAKNTKGQTAFEYLILVGGVIVLVLAVIYSLVSGVRKTNPIPEFEDVTFKEASLYIPLDNNTSPRCDSWINYAIIHDIDDDNKSELLLIVTDRTNSPNGRARVLVYEQEANFNARLSAEYDIDLTEDDIAEDFDVGDIDGDGKDEIVVVGWYVHVASPQSCSMNDSDSYGSFIYVLSYDESTGIQEITSDSHRQQGERAYGLTLTDIDGDGKDECVVVKSGTQTGEDLYAYDCDKGISQKWAVDIKFDPATGDKFVSTRDVVAVGSTLYVYAIDDKFNKLYVAKVQNDGTVLRKKEIDEDPNVGIRASLRSISVVKGKVGIGWAAYSPTAKQAVYKISLLDPNTLDEEFNDTIKGQSNNFGFWNVGTPMEVKGILVFPFIDKYDTYIVRYSSDMSERFALKVDNALYMYGCVYGDETGEWFEKSIVFPLFFAKTVNKLLPGGGFLVLEKHTIAAEIIKRGLQRI